MTESDWQQLSLAQAKGLYSDMMDRIVHIQSTDDLGSPEANQRLWDQMLALEKEVRELADFVKGKWGITPRW